MGREQELLKLLAENKGTALTVREMADKLGLKSPGAVHRYLRKLKDEGLIDWDPKRARTIRVLS